MSDFRELESYSKKELIGFLEDAAKNWLAHDGLWFLAAEQAHGMEEAMRLDAKAWERFTVIEARRIMKRLALPERGGLPALRKALRYRLYAHLNTQEIIEVNENKFIFRMNECRVQAARKRDGRPDFPCKPVGIVEYAGFAKTIDPRISTRCVACPPGDHPKEFYCAWEFELKEE